MLAACHTFAQNVLVRLFRSSLNDPHEHSAILLFFVHRIVLADNRFSLGTHTHSFLPSFLRTGAFHLPHWGLLYLVSHSFCNPLVDHYREQCLLTLYSFCLSPGKEQMRGRERSACNIFYGWCLGEGELQERDRTRLGNDAVSCACVLKLELRRQESGGSIQSDRDTDTWQFSCLNF